MEVYLVEGLKHGKYYALVNNFSDVGLIEVNLDSLSLTTIICMRLEFPGFIVWRHKHKNFNVKLGRVIRSDTGLKLELVE